jgi:cell division protein FtsL
MQSDAESQPLIDQQPPASSKSTVSSGWKILSLILTVLCLVLLAVVIYLSVHTHNLHNTINDRDLTIHEIMSRLES